MSIVPDYLKNIKPDPPISNAVQPMPLLVVQWVGLLTTEQYAAINSAINKHLQGSGWKYIVVDGMDVGCTNAYMPNGGNIEALSIDNIVSRIKGADETHNEVQI